MATNAKTFRLFISSPFRDFKKEREVLHKKVFPRIDEYCTKPEIGFSFQPIDLRWGVSNEAQLDQKTLEVCLEEVRACKHFPHPNFLIMTGDRYGYIPLPYMIGEIEFDAIKKYLEDSKRITDKEQEIIEYWYILDENQIPSSYVLTRREDQSNNTKISKHLRQDYATLNAPEEKDIKEWNKEWGEHESLMLKLFQEAVDTIIDDPNNIVFNGKSDKEYQKYFTSATEAEVLEGIIDYKDRTITQEKLLKEEIVKDSKVDKKYVFGYVRTINNPSGDYVDWNAKFRPYAKEFKENLVNTLGDKEKKIDYTRRDDKSGNILFQTFSSVKEYEEENELKEFEKFIYHKLKETIDQQVEQKDNTTPLEQEILEQQKFQQDKLKGFHGRDKTLSAIDSYISKKNLDEPLIIHGPSGMGKSSLMSAAIESRIICDIKTKKRESRDDNEIVYRFVGATEHSTTIRKLLISIADELQDRKLIDKIEKYEDDDNKFYEQIKANLSSIDEPIVIFIDALDQLQHKEYLNWLPSNLPLNIKIILSVLDDRNPNYKQDRHYYEVLSRRYNNRNSFIDIIDDSLEDNKDTLIGNLLEVEHRKINQAQRDYLLKQWADAEYSPLYLKIAIEEVKHWKSDDYIYDKDRNNLGKKQKLNSKVEGIIQEYLVNLDKIYHNEKLLIQKVFGYIHASKDGLSEKELLEILSKDLEDEKEFQKAIINEYHEPIKSKNPKRGNKEELVLPMSIWSRLHTQIKPFIIERNIDGQPLMKFFHRQFTSVVEELYTENEKETLHKKLAEYFLTLQDTTKTWDERYNDHHMLDELPYHLFYSKNSEKLKEILFDLEFAGSVYDYHKQDGFREIMEKASELDGISESEIYPWESFYREKEHLITKIDVEMWRLHQSLFQLAYEDGENSPLSKSADNFSVTWHWMKNKLRPKYYFRSGLLKSISIEDIVFNYSVVVNDSLFVFYNDTGIMTFFDINSGFKETYETSVDNIDEIYVLDNNTILIWSCFSPVIELLNINDKKKIEIRNETSSYIGYYYWKDSEIIELLLETGVRESWNILGIKQNDDTHSKIIKQVIDSEKYSPYNSKNIFSDLIHILNNCSDQLIKNICKHLLEEDSKYLYVDDGAELILVYSDYSQLIIYDFDGNLLKDDWNYEIGTILENGILYFNIGTSFSGEGTLQGIIEETYIRHEYLDVLQSGGAIKLSDTSFLPDFSVLWHGNVIMITKGEGYGCIYLREHNSKIKGVVEYKQYLLSWDEEGRMLIWSWNQNDMKHTEIIGHNKPVEKIFISGDNIVSLAFDSVKVWNVTPKLEMDHGYHNGQINGMSVDTYSNLLSWSDDGTVRMWDEEGNKEKILLGFDYLKVGTPVDDAFVLEMNYDIVTCSYGSNAYTTGSIKQWNLDNDNMDSAERSRDYHNRRYGYESDRYDLSKTYKFPVQDGFHMLACYTNGEISYYDELLDEQSIGNFSKNVSGALELEEGTFLLWNSNGSIVILPDVVEFDVGYSISDALYFKEENRIVIYSDETVYIYNDMLQELSNIEIEVTKVVGLNDDLMICVSGPGAHIYNLNGELQFSIIHGDVIKDAQVTIAGRLLTYSDKIIKLWHDDRCIKTFDHHKRPIIGIINCRNRSIVSFSASEMVINWDRMGGSFISVDLECKLDGIIELNNGNIAGWSYKNIYIWNGHGEEITKISPRINKVEELFELDNGTYVSSTNGEFLTWDEKGKLVSNTGILPVIVNTKNSVIIDEKYFIEYSDNEIFLHQYDYTPQNNQLMSYIVVKSMKSSFGIIKAVRKLSDSEVYIVNEKEEVNTWNFITDELAKIFYISDNKIQFLQNSFVSNSRNLTSLYQVV